MENDSYKKVCAIVLAVSMLAVYFPADQMEVHAADRVGTLSNGDQIFSYDDFDDLVDDLEDNYEGKSVTITMSKNWDSVDDSAFDQRLIIPSKCKAILDMNGYVFDRNNTADNDWEYNGELICVESGSTLTVNGGKELRPHDVRVYSSTSRDSKASSWLHFEGGGLANGASTGGAGVR